MHKRASEFLIYAQGLGISEAYIFYGSKHPQIRGSFNGRVVRYAFSGSPSDFRSMANARSGLRRYLHTMLIS